MDNDLNNEEFTPSLHKNIVNTFLEGFTPNIETLETEEKKPQELDTSIDDTIDALEKILKIKALSDNEWSEIHEPETELHEDIQVLDFNID